MPSPDPTNRPSEKFSGTLSENLAEAVRLEARRDYATAAARLDRALAAAPDASAVLRFQALVLRADVAVSLDDLGEARGILAEAKQVPLSPADRDALGADLRRADDLEVFLTHRGCAG